MIEYYLYIKKHTKTGLQYLGYTSKSDPFAYIGSGKYWKLHLEKHGFDYETTILQRCFSKNAVKEWGLFYSKLWSVAKSNKWANLIDEQGEGGACFGKINGMYGKKHTLKTRQLQSLIKRDKPNKNLKGYKQSQSHKDALSASLIGKNPHMDHKQYEFIHTNGAKEICTQRDLIAKYNLNAGAIYGLIHGIKNRKSHKGWMLSNTFVH